MTASGSISAFPTQDDLRSVAVLKRTAWVYVGRPEHRLPHMPGFHQVAVRQSYLDILQAGLYGSRARVCSRLSAYTDPFLNR
jgi:hypothetical protein